MRNDARLKPALPALTVTPWGSRPSDPGDIALKAADGKRLDADLRVQALGPIELIRWTADPCAIRDSLSGGGRPRSACYIFVQQLSGRAHVSHYGHQSALAPGELILLNEAAPFLFTVDEPGDLILLRVPVRLLRNYLPSPEYFCGLPLRAGVGISDSASTLVASISAQLDGALPDEFLSRIARNLLDVLATALSMAFDGALAGSPVICNRNARVRLFIEQNLRDPELRPANIAAHLRLSPRYLRAIFAASRETVMAYVLRRRLEECARELANPLLARLSITDIAFGWGFNSGPHFTRSFRQRFGASPRDYRRLSETTA